MRRPARPRSPSTGPPRDACRRHGGRRGPADHAAARHRAGHRRAVRDHHRGRRPRLPRQPATSGAAQDYNTQRREHHQRQQHEGHRAAVRGAAAAAARRATLGAEPPGDRAGRDRPTPSRPRRSSTPGEMSQAQHNLELVLDLRAAAINEITARSRRRCRRPGPARAQRRGQRRSTGSPARCRRCWPPTSSTPSASLPLIKQALDDGGVSNQQRVAEPVADQLRLARQRPGHVRARRDACRSSGRAASPRRAPTATA